MGKIKFITLSQKNIADIQLTFKDNLNFVRRIVGTIPRTQDDDNVTDTVAKPKIVLPSRLCPARIHNKKPAKTIEELQEKLALIKGKTGLPYKDKLLKKGLKIRLKKKEKKAIRKAQNLDSKIQNKPKKVKDEIPEQQLKKPIYNSEGQMVFSKFDFSEFGVKAKKTPKGVSKDPAVQLKKVLEQKERMEKLKTEGQKETATKIKETISWKNALMKSEGVKVRDNPELLKATIKKTQKRKEKSAAKWKANQVRVEKEKQEKQKKRMTNIQARSKQKKLNKMKKQAKRGRLIAGF